MSKESKRILPLLWRFQRTLSNVRKRQFGVLFVLVLISAAAEVVSLGAVIPFLTVLTVPEKLMTYEYAAPVLDILAVTQPQQLALPLTIGFLFVIAVSALIRVSVLWLSTRFTFTCGADLSVDVYRRSLYQPYAVHISRNSSEVIAGITQKVNGAVFGVLLPLLSLLNSAVLLVVVTVALFLIDPLVASVATAGFGFSYAIVSLFTRRQLKTNGERIAKEQTRVVQALQEGLGGIRDVLLDGTQAVFCRIYHDADVPLRRAMGNNVFIAGSPRFLMEAVGMSLIVLLAYVLSGEEGGLVEALPVLGALALGAQRLLPALQMSYSSWATIVGNQASLQEALSLMEQPLPEEASRQPPQSLHFKEELRLEKVGFRYSPEGPWVLRDISLKIPRGSRIGFIGTTGSGKSTLLDLIMGLLEPTEGHVLIDGVRLQRATQRAWQRKLAHVPQDIYLADTTLEQNVAFGQPKERMDYEALATAVAAAQASDFFSPTEVSTAGERGVRLSGGQRQRIGIARALYKQAELLIFDEATSALDNETERAVMQAIESISPDVTVLQIAHRLSTVRNCDMIYRLENGRIAGSGTFDQLVGEDTMLTDGRSRKTHV